jgi:hypothetical protein
MSHTKTFKITPTCFDHHQGAIWSWLKSLVKIWVFKCGYAGAYGHSFCMLYCAERHVNMSLCTIQHTKWMTVCCRITTLEDSNFNQILTRIKKLLDDDQLGIETCWSDFKCFITNKCISWTITHSELKCTEKQWNSYFSVTEDGQNNENSCEWYTFLINMAGSPFTFNTAGILLGVDSCKFWKVFSGILYHSSRTTFSSCLRDGGGYLLLTLHSKTDHSGLMILKFGDNAGKGRCWNLSSCSSNQDWTLLALCTCELSSWKNASLFWNSWTMRPPGYLQCPPSHWK